jgi:predicted esterase
MTIGTNSIFDEVMDRKIALQDALISLKAEQARVNSHLFNSLDTNLIALGGWSMGGGGAQLVAAENPNIKAILAFCPWIDPAVVSPALLNHNTPILFFSGQIDAVAPPSAHADVQYNYTPSSTNKLKYEVLLGGHTIANNPINGFGEVGRMGVSWLKKYLVNDSCYCPLLLDVPTTASGYITNIDCSVVSPSWDCDSQGNCTDSNTGGGQYSTLTSCLLDSCSVTTNTVNYTTDIFLYPNPSNSMVVLKGAPNNSPYNIISVDGKLLKSSILNGNKIDISDLKKGIYFLEYENQKMKLIKN